MNGAVLFVDDESRVLAGYERSLNRQSFDVECASSGAAALEMLGQGGTYDVVVSDLRMPGMDGVEFLTEVARRWPDTFRILLTGAADLQTAVSAVNKAGVFRLLLKPCPSEDLIGSLREALRLRLALVAEKELLEQTVTGSVALCMDLLSACDPFALRHGERLLFYARRINKVADFEEPWRLQLAAMLAPVGFVALPAELKQAVAKGAPLDESQAKALGDVPYSTHRLLSHIPRLELVADIVLRAQVPTHECPPELWREAAVLSVLLDLVSSELEAGSLEGALASLKAVSQEREAALSLVRRALGG